MAGNGVKFLDSAIYQYICEHIPEEDILLNEPMSRHTTFRVGGEAKALLKIKSEEQLLTLIPYFQETGTEYFIIGNGSNLLVGDKGYQGIILQIAGNMKDITVDGTTMTVKAGCLMSEVAKAACEHGLTGFEFASGIPGTIGGGVVMNAGAYDGEMKQVVEWVRVMNSDGEILELSNDDMEFSYRNSVIKNRKFVVLQVKLSLQEGKREEIHAKMAELNRRRREKQPLEYPSAGSTFKRPEGYYAGKLIMDAGLRGYSIGGAGVSEKHCGFVINKGKATAADVAEVIQEVQERIKKKFGVTLETEVIFLGDF